jgi:hypothetical protein
MPVTKEQMMSLCRVALVATACLFAGSVAYAGDLTKEECVDAHSRGQDAKEQNKLSLARKLFLTCAQPACPSLVQGDCARFADELSRMQPSITFVARDGAGTDLPDTTVYVDGALVVTRLDGSSHDVDPGSHTVKFQNGSKEQVMTVVIGSGEKGRTVAATFGSPPSPNAPATTARPDLSIKRAPIVRTTHPKGSKALIIGGAALTVGGAALGVVGILRVPSNCTLSSHQCAAPPGDPSIANASSAVKMSDYGWAIGITGVVALAVGTYWYTSGAKKETDNEEHVAVTPWLAPTGGGLAISGAL